MLFLDSLRRRDWGFTDAQTMNMTLLMKWETRIMSQQKDIAMQVLKEKYGRELN